jgi:hypothetical protein
VALGAPAPVAAGRTTQVRLGTVPAAASALRGCDPLVLRVTLQDGGGRVLARRVLPLAPEPPRCGRFFSAQSTWNRPLPANAPTDPVSAQLAGGLTKLVAGEFQQGFAPTINTRTFSTPIFTASAGQRRVPVKLVGSRISFGAPIAKQLAEGVPIPPNAHPANGSDHHVVIWQPATDTMWELWGASASGGRWEAQWGGRMTGVSRSPGYFTAIDGILPGATASSLPLVGGLITGADLARGSIDHALAFAVPNTRSSIWTSPAQRTDGGSTDSAAIPMGARFRVDPRLDVDALRLPHLTAMMAKAAQRYGMVVRDTAPVVAFVGEDPAGLGTDPWRNALRPSTNEVLKQFPWSHLQLLRMDPMTYGNKPVPSRSLVSGGG